MPPRIPYSNSFAQLAKNSRAPRVEEEAEARRVEVERVTESRAHLMRGLSHDIKNPLGAADGYLQLLEEGIMDPLTEKQRASVERVRRAIGHALALIEDLLTLARTDGGQLEIEHVPTDVKKAAEEIVGEFMATAEARGLTLTLQAPDHFPLTHSDAGRVRQILGNLISNALKYTLQGGAAVRAEEREGGRAPGPGRWVAVDVSDTGPGIPEDQRVQLFEEFRRLETAGEMPGAGIGLSISLRLAGALGGTITVASEVGRGSTFTLWLPLVPDDRRARPRTA